MSDDRYVAFALLSTKVGHVLGNKELFPSDIFSICYDYVFMVILLFEQEDIREELLK